MPAALAVGDRVQVRIWSSDAEQASVNTVYYKVISLAGTGASDARLATDFDAVIAAAMKNLLNVSARYDGVQVTIVNRLPLPVSQTGNVNAGLGTRGINSLPRQAAGILSIRTDIAGPRGRGRLYLPFPSGVDNTDPGRPLGAYITNAELLGADMLAFASTGVGANTANLQWVVWSKVHAAMIPVVNYIVPPFWATMKKRGSYGRPNRSPI